MRTTLNIDDGLLKRASQLTGVTEKTALLRLGLEVLIALESLRRLATLGAADSTAAFGSVRVLVDTPIRVQHLHRGDARLTAMLEVGEVWCHLFVIGELACGRY